MYLCLISGFDKAWKYCGDMVNSMGAHIEVKIFLVPGHQQWYGFRLWQKEVAFYFLTYVDSDLKLNFLFIIVRLHLLPSSICAAPLRVHSPPPQPPSRTT
jgi:hypothetical protein